MAGRGFDEVVADGLLRDVEVIVVEAHRKLYESEGLEWSQPIAYRWLRYEDPLPVDRLAEGVERLRRRGAEFDSGAVDKVRQKAVLRGFSN